jgi:hypothetical protein
MLGKNYQVLGIGYAVAERRRADISQILELATILSCQPFIKYSECFVSF